MSYQPARWKTILFDIFDIIAFLIFVVGIVLFIRFFIFNPYSVVGRSMEPNFHDGDFIIIDKVTSQRWTLERGDIIVFVPPWKEVPYIKRIVWLPGETIRITDEKLYICADNNEEQCTILNEDYLKETAITKATCGRTIFPIPLTGWYFTLGDNRGQTTDSLCCFGIWCYQNANYLVPDDHIIGKVLFRVFPDFDVF